MVSSISFRLSPTNISNRQTSSQFILIHLSKWFCQFGIGRLGTRTRLTGWLARGDEESEVATRRRRLLGSVAQIASVLRDDWVLTLSTAALEGRRPRLGARSLGVEQTSKPPLLRHSAAAPLRSSGLSPPLLPANPPPPRLPASRSTLPLLHKRQAQG